MTRLRLRRALAALAIFVAGCNDDDADVLEATGTVEVRETDVAPTLAARVVRVLVDEGDSVRAGDTLAVLTLPTLEAELAQRRSRVAGSAAQVRELERGPRDAELDRARADLRTAEAEAVRSARDLERLERLLAAGAVSQQQVDNARAASRTAAGRRDAARQALRLLQEGTRPERVAAGRAELGASEAALRAAEATASDLVLRAPVTGIVVGRHVEPGEVIPAGTPAVTIAELSQPWVRVYVPGPRLPLVRLGARATATLDGRDETPFTGRVTVINPRAEYTPRVALTEDERADLMFGVKVELDDTTGALKPGLPVTVRIESPPMTARVP